MNQIDSLSGENVSINKLQHNKTGFLIKEIDFQMYQDIADYISKSVYISQPKQLDTEKNHICELFPMTPIFTIHF